MCERRLVVIPSYNSGSLLGRTAGEVLDQWADVWVVIDGSTDGSGDSLRNIPAPGLRVLTMDRNSGKGAAVLSAFEMASREGFTHGLVFDSDGQHPAGFISEFMRLSTEDPLAMVLGVPVFGEDAPRERVYGRHFGNALAELETLFAGIRDSLFGFRLYPIGPFLSAMKQTRSGRRFDFDTEIAVRLLWNGVRPINRPVPVKYLPKGVGGITHFHYLRDNLLLAATHAKLLMQMFPRLPRIWQYRKEWRSRLPAS